MNRMTRKFAELKEKNEKALVAYLTAGDPDYETSLRLISAACAAGVDVLELGVPFSDPTADGPVIQEASLRALSRGMNIHRCFDLARDLRGRFPDLPIILFSYYNPLFQFVPEELYRHCVGAGIDALLVVDLPPEESEELTAAFPDPRALPLIRLIAPTTPAARKAEIAQKAQGFLYLITRTGVTGAGALDESRIARHTAELRAKSQIPVCLGFGISTPEDIRRLAPYADGLVVGSALVRLVAQHGGAADAEKHLAEAVRALKDACRF